MFVDCLRFWLSGILNLPVRSRKVKTGPAPRLFRWRNRRRRRRVTDRPEPEPEPKQSRANSSGRPWHLRVPTGEPRGKKVEITPQLGPLGAQRLARRIGCFGVVWNFKVGEEERSSRAWSGSGRPPESRPKPNQAASHFVDENRPWLGEVPSQIRRNADSKCFEAKQAAIKGLRKSPRFRRSFGKKCCVVTSELFEARVAEGRIFLAFKASAACAPFCSLVVEL